MIPIVGVSFEFGTVAESMWDYITSSQQAVIALFGITVGIVTYVITHRKEANRERRQANREVYQRLELASIDLWRNEGKDEMIRLLWDGGKIPVQYFERLRLENAACQYLNLFEMAVQFRKDGVIPREVFGSWVIWMFEFGEAKLLPQLWDNIELNYTPALRKVISYSIEVWQDDDLEYEEKRDRFFNHVADHFGCEIIRDWCLETDQRKNVHSARQ